MSAQIRPRFALVALTLSAAAAHANVLWRGGFENGTRSEFSRYHAVQADPPRIAVVPRPAADGVDPAGTLAARVELRTGDDARKLDPRTGEQIGTNDYNERAELQVPNSLYGHTFLREGDDVWITWQAMFPSGDWWGLDPKGGGTVFFQLHHVRIPDDRYDGSPPLMFTATNTELKVTQCTAFLCTSSATRHEEPLRFDHWYTFVLHAKHSRDPAVGRLELWIDGRREIDLATALLYGADFGNYILTGQYRRPNTVRTGVLFLDNFVLGTAQADVMPTTPPPPVEPEPVEPEPVEPEPVEPGPQPDAGEAPDAGDATTTDAGAPPVAQPDHDDTCEDPHPVVIEVGCAQASTAFWPALLIGAFALLRNRRR